MAKKLYVGSLPYSVDDTQLGDLAKEYGEVLSANVIKDKFSGQSKGFGFVEMANDGEAEAAINGLNGREVGGRTLKVNEARPMAPRSGGGGFGGGGGGGGRRFGGGGGGGGGRRDNRGGGGGGGGRW